MSILDKYPNIKKTLESDKKISVAICTPIYGGVGTVEFFLSLMKTRELLGSVGINCTFNYTKQESLIQRARNTLVARVLDENISTHIFFIDVDISWNEHDVLVLLENDMDIIGAIYPKKAYDFKKIVNSSEILKFKNMNDYNNEISDENFIKHHLVNYNFNYGMSVQIVNNIIEVKHLATGFMMIKVEVFKKMIASHPEWEYVDDVHNPPSDIKFYSFFDCGIKDKHYLSEDWMFCERWIEMGGKIHANIVIPLTHIGSVSYEGRLLSTLDIK